MKTLKLTKRLATALSVFLDSVPAPEIETVGGLRQMSDLVANCKSAAKSYYEKDMAFGLKSAKDIAAIKKDAEAGKDVTKMIEKYNKERAAFEVEAKDGETEIALDVDESAIVLAAKLFDKYGTKTAFPKEDIFKLSDALAKWL